MSKRKKKNPYDASDPERIKELRRGKIGKVPPGMNPYTGKPAKPKRK